MNFNEIIELDVPADAIILRSVENNSVIKIKEIEIEEIKIKKSSISFFTINRNYKNPLKPEFTILIYTLNNIIIESVFEASEEKTLKELEEYIKSILI